jgi:hypothetical protein
MKRIATLVIAAAIVFGVGLVVTNQSAANNGTTVDVQLDLKRCSTSSDCPNSKCSGGQCGACSTSSDCKYGKCSSSKCGSCSTSSDCNGWGKCSSGQCGSCSTSSDCGSFGSCSGGKCSKSPY